MSYEGRLLKSEWEVKPISLLIGQDLVKKYHYAHGGSNTGTYVHGLFRRGSVMQEECCGVAWWIPPTKSAALATYPQNWMGVLCLSRLVIVPNIPKNACSFLLSGSMKLIDRKKWPCLVTYADEWQGHNGTIYKASNWKSVGKTSPEATYVLNGRLIARKATKTRTHEEMKELGAEMIGRFSKYKFVHMAKVTHDM